MYKHDWYMRQIELWVQFVAKAFFGKDVPVSQRQEAFELLEGIDGGAEGESWSGQTLPLRRELSRLIDEGGINEAENLLFESIVPGDRATLAAAMAFYWRLSALDDVKLASCAFQRDEIEKGLKDALMAYGADVDAIEGTIDASRH